VELAINEAEIKQGIIEVLKTVFDPEIPVNIYDLGLIYEINVFPDGNVEIVMTLTSPNCPAAGSLPGEVEQKARAVAGVKDVTLELVFDPPWSQEMMSEEAKLELGFL
jgi:FeS assembly SUF system protein